MIKILIFGNTIQQVQNKFKEYISSIKLKPDELIMSYISSTATYKDKLKISTSLCLESSREYRVDKLILPEDISIKFYHNIAIRLLTGSVFPKNEQIVFY